MESVLKKKIWARRVGRSPLPDIDLIGENFGRLLEDQMRPLLKTIVGALIMECEITKLSDVVDSIPVPAMLGVVEVSTAENFALINLSADLVYHIIDMRMGGDPTVAPMPTTRSFTAIDIQLCADIFDGVLAAFTKSIFESLGVPLKETLSIAAHKQDINTVRIAPKSADVLLLKVSLDIGEAARSGDFDLIIPLSVLDIFKASTNEAANSMEFVPRDLWRRQMQASVANAPVVVHAVIARAQLSVSDLKRLKEGQVLTLPRSALEAVELIHSVGTEKQFSFGGGKLGAANGQKVVKLTTDPDTGMTSHLNRLIRNDD
jgi:flagellar motor switch protein FliM